jgi:excisionase family DNA binding protein
MPWHSSGSSQETGTTPGCQIDTCARPTSPTLLGVPVDTIYQWRHKRTGPLGFRFGRHLRFDPRALQRWIEAQSESVV